MNWRERIAVSPDVLAGKPVVRGTRISVELVIEQLAAGWSVEDILGNHPTLSAEDVSACLAYTAELLRDERVYPVPT